MNHPTSKYILFILVQLSLGAMVGGVIGYAIALTTGLNLIITTATAAGLGIIIACCVRHTLYRTRTLIQYRLDEKNREAQATEVNNDSDLLGISKTTEPQESKQLTASKHQPLSSTSLGVTALTTEKPDSPKGTPILTSSDSDENQKKSFNGLSVATNQKDRSDSKLASLDRTPQKGEPSSVNDGLPKTGENQSLAASSPNISPSSSEYEYSTPAQASPESSQSNSPTNSQRSKFKMSLNGKPVNFESSSNLIKRYSSYSETKPKA